MRESEVAGGGSESVAPKVTVNVPADAPLDSPAGSPADLPADAAEHMHAEHVTGTPVRTTGYKHHLGSGFRKPKEHKGASGNGERTGGPGDPTPPPPGTRTATYGGRDKKKIAKIAGLSVLGLIVVWALVLFVWSWVAWDNIPRVEGMNLPAPGPGEVIMFVGNNTREGIQNDGQFGTAGEAGGARSDSLILIYFPEGHAKATLISVSRDLYVANPAYSVGDGIHQHKIDSALNGGSIAMVKNVTQNLGIEVNHYVEMNFDGVRELTNALGGVTIDVPYAIRDQGAPSVDGKPGFGSGLNIPAGKQTLDGDQALAFVRARHVQFDKDGTWVSDPSGDLGRQAREQYFLAQMMHKLSSPAMIFRLPAVASAATNVFTLDPGFSFWHVLHLSLRFFPFPSSRIQHACLPVQDVTIQGVSFTKLKEPIADETLDAIKAGKEVPSEVVFDVNDSAANPTSPPAACQG